MNESIPVAEEPSDAHEHSDSQYGHKAYGYVGRSVSHGLCALASTI